MTTEVQMLEINVPDGELWIESKQQFVQVKGRTLRLEHSLIAISKWESRYHKAFLGRSEKTPEEILEYIKCMTITPNVDPNIYLILTSENLDEINKYLADPLTATWFCEEETKPNNETVTSELIYYWMISFNIPVEFERWPIQRLMTLIRVCSIKNKPPKKVSQQATMNKYRELNAARRAKYHSKG